jgi:quercetin dioxygenase-like cupin family protein
MGRKAVVTQLERRTFDQPDETRSFVAKGGVDIVAIGGSEVGRATFEPGWRWSQHVGPIIGMESCQMEHVGFVVSGRQRLRLDDGTEIEVSAGDLVSIPPGHDGWTVGDEPCVILYFAGMGDYAKKG